MENLKNFAKFFETKQGSTTPYPRGALAREGKGGRPMGCAERTGRTGDVSRLSEPGRHARGRGAGRPGATIKILDETSKASKSTHAR